MLVKLDNPAVLSKAVDLISEIVTEVRIRVNEYGLSITAMDPANVSMVGFRIPKSAFSQFEVDSETLGVNLESLKKVLKRCGTGSTVIIEKKDNYLEINIYDRIKRNFSLSLIDIESEEIDFEAKTSRMEFSCLVEMNSTDFIDSIEDSSVVSDACSFVIKDGKFIIEAKGINSSRSEFSSDEAKITAETCKARYSLEYLQKFMKGAKLVDKVSLKFAEDHPLRIDYLSPYMSLSFVLAPRVENED